MYAVNVVLLDDKGGIPGRTMAEIFEESAGDVLHDLGGSPARCTAAPQEIVRDAVGSVRYPMLWRQAACAVELCQRAAEMAGEELPGSYRPGSRMTSSRR
jgi:hypothetical protein